MHDHLMRDSYGGLATRRGSHGPRANAPDPSEWHDAWRRGTEQARRRTPEVRLDVAYGPREGERFDLYLPTHRAEGLPFAAFVHGIDWQAVPRGASGFPAKAAHRCGAAFVTIGFGESSAVDLPAQAERVCRAWRFLVENARHFGLDPRRGHLIGHGYGAQLAALAAFDSASAPPASTVLLSGVYDLEPVRLAERNRQLGATPRAAAALSPIRNVRAIRSKVLVAWGEAEPDEARAQSRRFARACEVGGLDTLQRELPGRGELDSSLELTDPHSPVLATLRG